MFHEEMSSTKGEMCMPKLNRGPRFFVATIVR